MKRTINYTGRKRITNENYKLKLNRSEDHIESFEASFSLMNLELPSDAKLYIEAYHLSDYARYDFGTVATPAPVEGTDLTRLGFQENLKFRILVVDESGKIGRILALADKINPDKSGGQAAEKTLLSTDFKDIGQQVWLLEYEDSGEPVLVINKDLKNIAKTDIRFFLYIYPAVLREILVHLIFVTKIEDIDALDDWQKDWISFLKKLRNDNILPEILNPDNPAFDEDAVSSWIDESVKSFCYSRQSEWDKLMKVMEEE